MTRKADTQLIRFLARALVQFGGRGKVRVTRVNLGFGALDIDPAAFNQARLPVLLRDLPDRTCDLLARAYRAQLLLVANQDIGLAVDGFGDLALEVAAGELRQVLGGVFDGGVRGGLGGGLSGGLVGCRDGVRGSGGIGGRGVARGCGGVGIRGDIGVGDAIR